MDIQHILFVSPMYQEIQRMIEEKGLNHSFRFMPEENVTNDDFVWADAFVGFNLQGEFDYGQVQWVHSLGAGVDRFLHKKTWNENVLLTRTICSFGQRIGEYCLSYILKDIQYHNSFEQFQIENKWNPITPKLLSEQKVMVYGTGEIGQKTAQILSSFGVEVYGVSLSGKQKPYFTEVMSLEQHFSKLGDMNYLINTLPLTDKTENLFDNTIFEKVADVGFLNVGRGASLNEKAILEALEKSNVRFAVLDVFEQEPLPEGHPYWRHPNITVTPHISAVTTASEAVSCFLDTLRNIEANNPLHNQVDVRKGY